MSLILLATIILLILLSGFLSGSETAITATSKARIISKIKKGSKRANYVLKIINQKDSVITSLLLSNNLVNILASSLATAFFYDLFGITGIFYSTLLIYVNENVFDLVQNFLILFVNLDKLHSINQNLAYVPDQSDQ